MALARDTLAFYPPIVNHENIEKINELLSHRKSELGIECSRERKLARKERREKQA